MAIDWGRVAKGVATGYLGAKIANTEANDAMNADIIKRAGLNFYENTLPEFQLKEKNRKSTYAKVSAQYGPDVAEYMDQNDFIVGDASDYKNIVTLLGSNDGINETKLKAYLEATSAGTYTERAEKRVTSIQDREKTIMNLTSGSSKIGNMTADLLIDKPETMTDATGVKPVEYETITTPGEQVEGTPITTAPTTEKFPISFSTGTYAFDELFPKSKSLDLDIGEVRQLNSEAEKSFKRNIIKKAGGVETVPADSKYLIGYKESGATDKTKYAMDIYKKEYIDNIINQYSNSVTEGKQASTYAIPPGTKVSDIVIQARNKIAELQATQGDNADPYIEQIKSIVNEQLSLMNLEPSDFGF